MATTTDMDNWNAKLKKWRNGIKLEGSSLEEIQDYAITKAYNYKVSDAIDTDLWELFQDDFKDFTIKEFNSLGLKITQDLRKNLWSRGVYVAKNTKGLTIAKTLLDTAIEEEQHEWLDDEIREVCTIITDIKTIRLQSRIPLERLDKAFYPHIPPRTSVQPLQLPTTTPMSTLATTPIATLASTLAISTKITINALATIEATIGTIAI